MSGETEDQGGGEVVDRTERPDVAVLWFVAAALLLIVATFTTYGVALQRTINNVQDNTKRIEGNAWLSCNDLNAGFAHQNLVIDQEISRLSRAPHPDQTRIRGLQDFKLPLRRCGPRPGG